jgi:pimeloyl-ACP methyl ester carboxylesterase
MSGLRALAVLCLAAVAGCGSSEPSPPARSAAPGPQLFDVGGHEEQLRCTGSGSPTAIIESGLGVDPTSSWGAVVPAVARVARVCVHQRAGTGSSPPAGRSRTASTIATELGRLLEAAHVHPPLVLVGASFGGYVVQLYADRHAADVAGGISFDPGGEPVPSLERAWTRMQRDLVALSPHGRLIVAARSHHRIAEDQPGLVAEAIERVEREARAG